MEDYHCIALIPRTIQEILWALNHIPGASDSEIVNQLIRTGWRLREIIREHNAIRIVQSRPGQRPQITQFAIFADPTSARQLAKDLTQPESLRALSDTVNALTPPYEPQRQPSLTCCVTLDPEVEEHINNYAFFTFTDAANRLIQLGYLWTRTVADGGQIEYQAKEDAPWQNATFTD